MNREEAIYFANCLKNNYTIDLNDMQAFCDMTIKALEQESVIEKIRAEIVELTKCPYGTECLGANCPSNTDCMICGDHVLEIIDKYKAGKEQKDDNT